MPGVDRIWVPGERSHETRLKRTSHGIPIAPALLRGLDQVADELGIDTALGLHLLAAQILTAS